MLFIFNSDLQIVDTLSLKGVVSQGNTPYFDDYYTQTLATGSETFEFKTIADSKESKNIVVGNYIAFRDDNGEDKLFNITEIIESKSEDGFIKYVYCEMHGIELKNSIIRPVNISNASVGKFAETILSDSGWSLGKVDDFGALLDINIEDYISVYDAIQKYVIGEYGAEIYYTVEIKSNSVVNKYLNIVQTRGFDDGLRFTYNKNIQNIERTIDTSDLCTALIGVGNNGLTFKNIETDYKPLNQDFVENEDAYKQWSVNGYHVFGYEVFDTDSEQELLKLTKAKLEKRGTPKVKYELNAELLEDEVNIGDYIRITDMEFEPPITLSARISVLTKSKTDINGNTCEISNFQHLQSNITDQMRKLSTTLKGYADNINIDNINRGGFLSSNIEVVDDNTLKINNFVERGKDFCFEFKGLTAETILANFSFPKGKVMQQAVVDYYENKIYMSYDENGYGDITLFQLDMSGNILGKMVLNQFGHGNSYGIERRNNKTYIWLECDAKTIYASEPEKLRGTKICYFEFKDGVTATKTYGTVIDILPNWNAFQLAIDDTYNQLVVRALNKTGGTYYYHVYDLKSVVDGSPKLKYKFKDVGLQGQSAHQGFDILGNYIYVMQGAGYYTHPPKMDTYVTCIDIRTGKKRYVDLIDIIPDAPYREAEGIKVIKKSERVYELNFGIVTEYGNPRKNHIFKYTYTLPLEDNPKGKFIHPNGMTTSIDEGLIKIDNSKKRNYLMYVTDGERFNFEKEYSKQIIVANYENGTWYCNGEEFEPMVNDCLIGNVTTSNTNTFDLTIYSDSSNLIGHTLSESSDGLIYENGQILINASSLVGQLPSDLIEVESINANHISANAINAEKIQANSIQAEHITTEVFETIDANVKNLVADKANITDLNATNASIQNLQANKADIVELNTTKGEINQLKSEVAEIGVLKGDVAEIGNILAGNITAENIASGAITSDKIQTGAITAGSGIIADGAIGSAQISSLDASKINAGTIDTSKVTVQGTNGNLKIKGNRLQVFTGTGSNQIERVSLGDVNGNGSVYGLRVRGADGKTVLLDENGVTSEGITDGSISNEKISNDANIDGSKLNINSVVSKLNEDGTEVIKGTKIEVDGTSLATKLSNITSKQTEQGNKISENSASIKANENAIKLKVDNQTYQTDKANTQTSLNKHTSEINLLKGDISLKVDRNDVENIIDEVSGELIDSKINTAKAEIKVTTDKINQNVTNLTNTVSNKADGSTVSNLSNKVGSLETSLDNITQRVSSTESTTTTLTNKVNQVDGKIDTAKQDAISSAVGVKDTRNKNENPQWYFENYPRRTVEEFKYTNTVGISGSNVFGVLTTVVPWTESSGGYPTQTFRSGKTATYERKGTSNTTWGNWTQIENTTGSQEKATQALNDAKAYTTTEVTKTNNKVATIETNLNSITQRVSSTETTATNALNKANSNATNVSNLTTRVSNAESKLTKDSLITTIGSHYTTSTDVNNAITSKGYATTSEVQQVKNEWTATFKESGGYNLLYNSNFKRGFEKWTNSGATIANSLSCPQNQTGIKISGALATTKYCKQTVNIDTTKPFTISFWQYTSTSGSDGTTNPYRKSQATIIYTDGTKAYLSTNAQTTFETWELVSMTVKPTKRVENVTVELWNRDTTKSVYYTNVMLELGSTYTEWTPNPNEIYDGITTIDKDGIKVSQSNYNGYTQMKSDGFYINNGSENVLVADSNGLSVKGNITSGSTITGATITGGSLTIGNTSVGNFFKVNTDGSFQAGSVDQWNYKANMTYGNSGLIIKAYDDANSKARTISVGGSGINVGSTNYSEGWISNSGKDIYIAESVEVEGDITCQGITVNGVYNGRRINGSGLATTHTNLYLGASGEVRITDNDLGEKSTITYMPIKASEFRRTDGKLAYINGSGGGTTTNLSSTLVTNGMRTDATDLFVGVGGHLRVTDKNGYNSGNGLTYKPVTASAYNNGSDLIFKKNIKKLDDSEVSKALAKNGDSLAIRTLKDVNVYEYDLVDGEKNQIGLIAQECPQVLRGSDSMYDIDIKTANSITDKDREDLIEEDKFGATVNLYAMSTILWKVCQEQQETIEKLENIINKLDDKTLEKLEKRISKLESKA